MYLGRIVELGPTRSVLTEPLHPYTKALLDVVPEAGGGTSTLLAGEPPDPTRIPLGCRFNPRCPALADGTAGRAGVDASCTSLDPALTLLRGDDHTAACHLAAIGGDRTDQVPDRPLG